MKDRNASPSQENMGLMSNTVTLYTARVGKEGQVALES